MNRANAGYRSVPLNTPRPCAVASPPPAIAADQTPAVADTIAAIEAVVSARSRGRSPPAVAADQTPAVASAAPDGTPMLTRAPLAVAPGVTPIAAPDVTPMPIRTRVRFDTIGEYLAADVDAVGCSESVASARRRVDAVGDSESDSELVGSASTDGDTASDAEFGTEGPTDADMARMPMYRRVGHYFRMRHPDTTAILRLGTLA